MLDIADAKGAGVDPEVKPGGSSDDRGGIPLVSDIWLSWVLQKLVWHWGQKLPIGFFNY